MPKWSEEDGERKRLLSWINGRHRDQLKEPLIPLTISLNRGYESVTSINWMDSDQQQQQQQQQRDSQEALRAWRWGLEMGIWMFLGYAFQAVGLVVRIILHLR